MLGDENVWPTFLIRRRMAICCIFSFSEFMVIELFTTLRMPHFDRTIYWMVGRFDLG
jgi:hypothetical protein